MGEILAIGFTGLLLFPPSGPNLIIFRTRIPPEEPYVDCRLVLLYLARVSKVKKKIVLMSLMRITFQWDSLALVKQLASLSLIPQLM